MNAQFWNKRYAEPDFAYGILPNIFLVNELAKLETGKILFICEGEGRNAVYAAKNNWKVSAFDLSETGKQKALLLAKKHDVNLEYKITDALEADYEPNSFDVIALIYAHFPSEMRTIVHHKIIKWLKPNGKIILEAFNPLQLNNVSGGPKEISMLYSKTMLENDFASLKINDLNYFQTILDEGKFHQGKADIIRLKATKIS